MNQSLSNTNNKLFPTTVSFFIFLSYISLFVGQGLLVTAVQNSKIHGFNAIVIVLLTEFVKLFTCIIVYLIRSHGSISDLILDIKKNNRLLVFYLVPALLYCLYNNLTFINLKLFDLTTYYCLMQFRIVVTAIIYQILFKRPLNKIQWTSLIILTLGCFIKEYGLYDDMKHEHQQQQQQQKPATSDNLESLNDTTHHNYLTNSSQLTLVHKSTEQNARDAEANNHILNPLVHFLWLTLLLLLQMFCSCFAGVYNEFLLKDSSTSNNAGVILQNIFMYLDSIFCNIIIFNMAPSNGTFSNKMVNEELDVITTIKNLLSNPLVIILILNNALSGLVASFFLKSLNSILKTFASALELFAVAFLAWILFDNKVDIYTVIALCLVSAAMIVYSKNPVSVGPPTRGKDGFMLLPTSEE